jgi:hypothetical protein
LSAQWAENGDRVTAGRLCQRGSQQAFFVVPISMILAIHDVQAR